MTENAQALRQAQVMIPFHAQRTKGSLLQGQQYTVVGYTLFDGREACDLCDRPHQAAQQVTIETSTGQIRAGLDCLKQVSAITRTSMDRAVNGQVALALRVRRLTQGLRSRAAPTSFETTQETLEQLQASASEILRDTRSGEGILREISEIRRQLGTRALSQGDERRLRVLTDHLAYLQEAREHPERHQARVEALLNDPLRSGQPPTHLPLDRPDDLTPDQVQEVKEELADLRKLRMPRLSTPAVEPQEYATADAYRSALHEHYRHKVERGEVLLGTLQAQYDLTHFSELRLPVSLADVLGTLSLPCVTPIYAGLPDLPLESRSALNFLEARNRRGVDFYSRTPQGLEEVRTDRPRDRRYQRGLEVPADPEDRERVPCRYIAYWIPDPWHAIFPLWKAHGGREPLLTFPQTT